MAREGNGRGHTREDVVRAALRILDEYGLPDLTMRRLAASLDVQPSALYWHFPNKQSLLATLSDRIVAPAAPVAREDEWGARVGAEATALRSALLAWRDGAEVVASTYALGLGASTASERLARAIEAGGFDVETVDRAATALLHFVLGHVQHEQQRRQYDRLGLAEGTTGARPGDSDDGAFRFGVDLLVQGLRAHTAGVAVSP
ncbi:TetR/AcrR family transcriptional regulator C-terminal domain-containing protein [Microbacterium aureliae]